MNFIYKILTGQHLSGLRFDAPLKYGCFGFMSFGSITIAINLIQYLISFGTYICWQSKNATESRLLHLRAMEAGKQASKSFVVVKVIDKIFSLESLFRVINSSISSLTAISISCFELFIEVVAPLIAARFLSNSLNSLMPFLRAYIAIEIYSMNQFRILFG